MILRTLKKQPDLLLLFTSVICFFMIFICYKEDSTLDINVHDTYFVIAHGLIFEVVAVFFFILFAVYKAFDKIEIELFSVLSKIHIYGAVVSLVGMFFPYNVFFDGSLSQGNDFLDVNLIIALNGFLFLLVHLAFVFNIILGVFKKIRTLIK